MANQGLNTSPALDERTSPLDVDRLYLEDSTPDRYYIENGKVGPRGYGAIYVSAGAANQSLSATTWTR